MALLMCVLSPMEFMGRLAALVPRPRVNLTRFHGVFSFPNSKLRKYVVPQHPVEEPENPKPKAYSMTWAQRLKRVFAIEIEKCEKCGGPFRIIASIEDPDVIPEDPEASGPGSARGSTEPLTAVRTWLINKRRYSEGQHIDYRTVRVAIDQRLILEAIRRISDAQLIQLVDEAARKGGLKATPRDDDTFLNDEKRCLFLLTAKPVPPRL